MTIAYSTMSLFGFLATTAIGGALFFKGNKNIGMKMFCVGVLGLVANLMYNSCFRKNNPVVEKVTSSLQTDSFAQDDYESDRNNSDNLLRSDSFDDVGDFSRDDFETRRHPATSKETKGQAVERPPLVVTYKPNWRERITGLFTSTGRLTEDQNKEHIR